MTDTFDLSLTAPKRPGKTPRWQRGIYAGLFLYLFLCSINVMGGGLKLMAKAEASQAWIESFFNFADNPFVALMAGVLVTAIVQSSSFTTSMIITMAAAGTLHLDAAIFAVMGANIGTSVTGILVSLANIRIRRQFRRAFTAALVHDIFNLLSVAVLFPIEWMFHPLARMAGAIAHGLGLEAATKPHSPIKIITKPVVELVNGGAELFFSSPATIGPIVAIVGLLLLFFSLVMMMANLRGALLSRLEGLFRRVFFRNDLVAGTVGLITTVVVQSSSVTTSVIVPLAGAGAVKLRRVFPFMLGANVGTTMTGVLAAAAVVNDPATAINEKAIAATVAACHVLFNIGGILIWYPLRIVPLSIATWYGRLAARSKRYAILFLLVVFIVIPLVGLTLTELLRAA